MKDQFIVRVACDNCLKAKRLDEMSEQDDKGPWLCEDCCKDRAEKELEEEEE